MRLLAPIIEKKRRLGVDGWGATDEHVREVMAPIEKLFDAEFGGFDPYPFGRADFLATLVRNIMFAEALLGDFERRFKDAKLGDDDVALATSSKFANCTIRTPVAEIIARAATAPAIASR